MPRQQGVPGAERDRDQQAQQHQSRPLVGEEPRERATFDAGPGRGGSGELAGRSPAAGARSPGAKDAVMVRTSSGLASRSCG